MGRLYFCRRSDTMNRFAGVILLVGFCTVLQAEKYTSRWDNIDIDQILHSDRLLENYKNCLMDAGKCTADGSELKKNLPDALKTECSKCTAKQKVNTEKVIDYMIENKKEWWEELESKYDPTGIYYNRYVAKKKAKEAKPEEKKEEEGKKEGSEKKNEEVKKEASERKNEEVKKEEGKKP